MLKVALLIIIGVVAWFLVDSVVEYRYWKTEQKEGRDFVKTTLEHARQDSKEQLETELSDLQSSLQKERFDPTHENVEKLARIYMLADMLSPQNQNYFDFESHYIKVGSELRPGCHFEFLIHLYQKEAGLPELSPTNFCNGWSELDKEFTYSGTPPHARSELKY